MYPILVKIGPFPLHTFGVILAIAILVGSTLLIRETRRLGDPQITEDRIQRLIWWVVLAVIGGGRLMHVLVEHEYFLRRPQEILSVWKGGLVLYGGLLGTFFAVIGFAWKYRIRILRLCDLVAPSAFFGLGIGRWGCLMAGDDYGRRVAEPVLGVRFPDWIGIRFTNPDTLVPLFDANHQPLRGELLHPTQIYMSISAFTIAGVLFWVTRRKRFDGQVAGVAFVLYPIFRSFIEFFRGDVDRGFVGPFSTAQFTSLFVVGMGLLLLSMAPRRLLVDDLAAADKAAAATADVQAASARGAAPRSGKKGRRK